MTDRELLERAARAANSAGMKVLRDPHGVWRDCTGMNPAMNMFAASEWRPREDDGDAFRLALLLRISVWRDDDLMRVGVLCEAFALGADVAAIARRLIVRAAAEMAP